MKKIHFIGIKGVGVAPLAIIAKEAGFEVTGCDVSEHFITDELLEKKGILVDKGFSEDHLEGIDLVIATGAHGGMGNIEVKKAKDLSIPVWMQGQALGEFMKGSIFNNTYKGISIAGCHGKTTTTAMIATILKIAGKDPSFLIGTGYVPSLGSSGHFGGKEYFVAEADEYVTDPIFDKTPKFLWQQPFILVITNIDYDHPDVYPSLKDVKKAYEKFTHNIKKDGVLIINGDDSNCQELIKGYRGNIKTFGFALHNEYVVSDVNIVNARTRFSLLQKGKMLGTFETYAIGKHNALNACACVIVGLQIGLSIGEIQKDLLCFTGTKRRLEYKGTLSTGAIVYDDYAHHPTEIQKTLEGLRLLYPNKKIVCIFQPHTYSRTKKLFDKFLSSFIIADVVLIGEIFASKREKVDPTFSSLELVEKLKNEKSDTYFLKDTKSMIKYIKQKKFGSDTVIVTMGAGDIYKISKNLFN